MDGSVQKLMMAFLSIIIGTVLLAQIAVSGQSITTYEPASATWDTTGARINATTYLNYTVSLINNEPNQTVPSFGGQFYQLHNYSNLVVINATDGTLIPAAFVTANFSINLTNGELDHTTRTSDWNGTSVNISYTFVKYYVNTTTQITSGDAVDADYVTGWRANTAGCTLADIMNRLDATNSSGTAWAPTTDFVVNTAGYVTLVNSANVNGSTPSMIAASTVCPDDYLTQDWQRTVINLIPGFFALALIGVGLWLFYSIAKDVGIV